MQIVVHVRNKITMLNYSIVFAFAFMCPFSLGASELALKTVTIDTDKDGVVDIIQDRYYLGDDLKIMDYKNVRRETREISYFAANKIVLIEKFEGNDSKPTKLYIYDETQPDRLTSVLIYDPEKKGYSKASDDIVRLYNKEQQQMENKWFGNDK